MKLTVFTVLRFLLAARLFGQYGRRCSLVELEISESAGEPAFHRSPSPAAVEAVPDRQLELSRAARAASGPDARASAPARGGPSRPRARLRRPNLQANACLGVNPTAREAKVERASETQAPRGGLRAGDAGNHAERRSRAGRSACRRPRSRYRTAAPFRGRRRPCSRERRRRSGSAARASSPHTSRRKRTHRATIGDGACPNSLDVAAGRERRARARAAPSREPRDRRGWR